MGEIDSLLLAKTVEILSSRPSGLITDIDGTISPIAPTPEEARVTPTCRELLGQLSERLDLLAAVSGRAAVDAHAMVDVPQMVYVGNHGLELWQRGKVVMLPEAAEFTPHIATALQDVAHATEGIEGLLYENKGLTASIHYRLAADPAGARLAILSALERSPAARGLRWTEGRMVVEIRPPISANKGTAVAMLLARYYLRGAVYMGDDTTDVDAFQALREAGRNSGVRTLAVGVLARETPPAVREQADVTLPGVAGVESLLAALVANLPQIGPSNRRTGGTTTS